MLLYVHWTNEIITKLAHKDSVNCSLEEPLCAELFVYVLKDIFTKLLWESCGHFTIEQIRRIKNPTRIPPWNNYFKRYFKRYIASFSESHKKGPYFLKSDDCMTSNGNSSRAATIPWLVMWHFMVPFTVYMYIKLYGSHTHFEQSSMAQPGASILLRISQ